MKTTHTTPRQFRLKPETMAGLDAITAYLRDNGFPSATRTDAVRYAVTLAEKHVKKYSKKTTK
jgi:hypothetical protein